MTDNFGRETVTFERELAHCLSLISSSLSSQPINVSKGRRGIFLLHRLMSR